MTSERDVNRIVRSWMEEGVTALPDHVLDAVLDQVPATPQRQASWLERRDFHMNKFVAMGLGITAAVVAFLIVGQFLGGANVGVPGPTATPSAPETPTATPASATSSTTAESLDTSAWVTYASTQYPFAIGHPDDWNVDPADRAWDLDNDATEILSTATDDFTAPTGDLRVSAWSVSAPGFDQTYVAVGAWVSDYCQLRGSASCNGTLDGAVKLCVEVRDCHPGLLIASDQWEVQAFFTGGIYDEQMVVVTIWRGESDPSVARYGGGRRLLEAFLSTMCVWPEDARPEPPPPCF